MPEPGQETEPSQEPGNDPFRAFRQQGARVVRAAARRRILWRDEPIYRVKVRTQLVAPYYRRRFHSFGTGVLLDRPMWLYGPQHISIGDHSIILKGAWLAVERPAWGRPDPVLQIGSRFAARPFITISAASSVIIEDNVGMASFATIIDSDHTWASHSTHVLDSEITAEPIRIGEGTFIAERAAVLKGTTLGKQCFVGANTLVKGNFPDYSVVLGVPGRVVGSTRSE